MSATASTPLLHKSDIPLLELLSHGLTDGMIGRELDVPAETVRSNIRVVVDAVGARNREHAVALALKTGLIQ
jgi:DNA-binding NarL/FixJ family response regulator